MPRPVERLIIWLALVLTLTVAALCLNVARAEVVIPQHSALYRWQLERIAGAEWGLNAPVARLAAQIHQESRWKPAAASKYAQGLAQFTPATASWIPKVCPQLGAFDPWDAHQSMQAMICYDAWLLKRVSAATECDRWAFALSDYNGGSKWRALEQRAAAEAGLDRTRWFNHTATRRARSEAAWKENRGYVQRILGVIERAYVAAGWTSGDDCHKT
ncbi:MAG: transglycosylase SLT domain-containing protein [Xanthomonadales bacterium]|nr:transglycosylase SLT domain-containing protein [Xanthomonadales bacterium]